MPANVSKPPAKIISPAPKDAAIPAIKLNRLIASTTFPTDPMALFPIAG